MEGAKSFTRQNLPAEALFRYSYHFSHFTKKISHFTENFFPIFKINFKTPRKCGIFGIMCEAVPWQVNYLIDETSDNGKRGKHNN